LPALPAGAETDAVQLGAFTRVEDDPGALRRFIFSTSTPAKLSVVSFHRTTAHLAA
jgi:hypothetical protein